MRLELLEGVGAFHMGDKARAKAALEAALAKWERLQVSDGRLAELLNMGFTSSEVPPVSANPFSSEPLPNEGLPPPSICHKAQGWSCHVIVPGLSGRLIASPSTTWTRP